MDMVMQVLDETSECLKDIHKLTEDKKYDVATALSLSTLVMLVAGLFQRVDKIERAVTAILETSA